jgi:hypothetical protein
MENEIMNVATEVMDDGIVADTNAGMGTGVAMLIGAGVTAAVFAGIGLAKKGIAAIKAKKAKDQGEPDPVDAVEKA